MRIYSCTLSLAIILVFLNGYGLCTLCLGLKVIKTLISTVGKIIEHPTTVQLFYQVKKNLLCNYPVEFVSTTINEVCSEAVTSEHLDKIDPDINALRFQLRTADRTFNYPLLKANKMWRSKEFDVNKKVVVLATGWMNKDNESDIIAEFTKAFACRGNVNFVVLDVADCVDTLYTWSAMNTERIGQHLATGLKLLVKVVPLKNIHLIGHSLGAHVVGAAGRHFHYETDEMIPHITGLDPAKHCFNDEGRRTALTRGDADFIDVIHSNSGVMGNKEPMGDVDFYPGGMTDMPPGCATVSCSHARAWQYYVETIYPGNQQNFQGKHCSSFRNLGRKDCDGKVSAMGYAVSFRLKGTYYLDVYDHEPFGMNADTEHWDDLQNCGL